MEMHDNFKVFFFVSFCLNREKDEEKRLVSCYCNVFCNKIFCNCRKIRKSFLQLVLAVKSVHLNQITDGTNEADSGDGHMESD